MLRSALQRRGAKLVVAERRNALCTFQMHLDDGCDITIIPKDTNAMNPILFIFIKK